LEVTFVFVGPFDCCPPVIDAADSPDVPAIGSDYSFLSVVAVEQSVHRPYCSTPNALES
jgi:hypothetical protein